LRAGNGGEMNNNPRPANKAGGLTTILEKIGSARRRRAAPRRLNGVYHYAEPVTAKGFVYMDTPGYDPVSATGQVAGGAKRALLHDRARLRLRLQADALDQVGDQQRNVQAHGRGHGHQLRRRARRRHDRGEGQRDFRADPGRGVRRAQQVGVAGLRRGGVRAVQIGATM